MKKYFIIIFGFIVCLLLIGCGNSSNKKNNRLGKAKFVLV